MGGWISGGLRYGFWVQLVNGLTYFVEAGLVCGDVVDADVVAVAGEADGYCLTALILGRQMPGSIYERAEWGTIGLHTCRGLLRSRWRWVPFFDAGDENLFLYAEVYAALGVRL